MLKRIPLVELRVGMFIQELGGNWLNHPFWRGSFKLTAENVQAVRQCGVTDVVIDTDKGLDVESAPATKPPPPPPPPLAPAPPPPVRVKPTVPFEQEIERAKANVGKAEVAVTSMFNDALLGQAINVASMDPLVDEIVHSIERNGSALLSMVRRKTIDNYTYMHSVAVCGLMLALGRRLGLDGEPLRLAGLGGLLHDVGKVAIPIEVLNKPGKLSDEEFELVKRHPLAGWEMLKQSNLVPEIVLDICRHHHERVDGKGYPDQISGDELTLYARMAAVCDVYDSITSDRPYNKAWTPADSIKRMMQWCDGRFDEGVFKAFVRTVGIYPTGSLVRLKSGRLGVVIDQSETNLLEPKVKVFFSTKSQEPITMEVVDLARSRDSIADLEDPGIWQNHINRIIG